MDFLVKNRRGNGYLGHFGYLIGYQCFAWSAWVLQGKVTEVTDSI